MQQKSFQDEIITSSKKPYSACQKVFCLRCFNCLKDEIIITSSTRKQMLQKMIKNYVINEDVDSLYDPVKLLILIYLWDDQEVPKKHIERCRLTPNAGINEYRTDLEFYIPQLCNYIVFYNNLKNNYIMEALERASKISYYFGHEFYFFMLSLEKTIDNYEIHTFKQIEDYNSRLLQELNKHFEGQMLNSVEFLIGEKIKKYPTQPEIGYKIKCYGTKFQEIKGDKQVKCQDITLPNYTSIFTQEQPQFFSFKSNINFFNDLFMVSEELKTEEGKEDKFAKLKDLLMQVNSKLPACVYIPFTKNYYQHYSVLNIITKETKMFSTKQRAPFYICVEVFCPAETLSEESQKKFWEKVETPLALKQTFCSETNLHGTRKNSENKKFKNAAYFNRERSNSSVTKEANYTAQTQIFGQKDSNFLTNKLLQFSNDMKTQPRLVQKGMIEMVQKTPIENNKLKQCFEEMFGESDSQFFSRYRSESIYGALQSWDLIHFIVKIGDNLKQEQFALQLIYQFDYIFKLEKVPLILTPYQVLSMGPDCGIIEMVRNSVTFDKLKRTLKTNLEKQYSLKEYFQIYFTDNLHAAKMRFMKSLVAYSLVMYFLQVKDRHNGNILLHKSGKIFHIDFGFLLSNMPGKGIELERKIPFKFMTEYIEVLDGPESSYFKKFRQLFFQGFKAIHKHQNKVSMLVKMMYSSSGNHMPCFQKGEETIKELEARLNPPHSTNDAQLNLHCQELINISLDNRRTRWYDYWQYYFQGIFY